MTNLKEKISRVFPLAILFLVIFILFFFIQRNKDREILAVRRYSVMGGIFLDVKLYGKPEELNSAFDAIFQKVNEVDKVCNIYKPESELSRLNQSAYDQPFVCSKLLWDVLWESKKYYELSGGAFDISAAPLMKLWGFYRKRKTLPSPEELIEVKKYVGLNKVIFDKEKRSIKFTLPGMRLDLGGIAKGFAVDLAANVAKKYNITAGLINLSGNAYCFPKPFPGKKRYIIGVRNPIHKNAICGKITLMNQSVATSGDYERYVIIKGRHYAHIMDPRTGDPVENMLSATVITPSATAADALSTSIFINGAKFAEKFHKSHPDTSFLIIRKNDKGLSEMLKIGDAWGECALKE